MEKRQADESPANTPVAALVRLLMGEGRGAFVPNSLLKNPQSAA
jgi:hypothetical protein